MITTVASIAGGLALTTPTAMAASTAGVFVVNSTNDASDAKIDGTCATASGACTLRAALQEANAFAGHAEIDFNIAGTGPFKIQTTGRYPNITNANGVTIDGYTQPGAAPNTAQYGSNAVIMINIQGQGAAAYDGFEATTSGNVFRGLAIYNFRHSIWFEGTSANQNSVVGNFICTDSAGVWAAPAVNGGAGGVLIQDGSSYNVVGTPALVDRNIISGCAHRGVIISNLGTKFNTVQNNVVGLNPSGTAALPNWSHGIDVNYAAQDNLVGGPDAGDGNVVSGNIQEGIEVSHGSYNRRNDIIGNLVGTDLTGTSAPAYAANGMMGIRLEGEKECDPCDPGAGYSEVAHNVVVNSGGADNWGGMLIDKGQNHNSVHDNWIGVLPNGTPAPNIGYGVRIEHGAIDNTIGPNNVIAFNQGAGVEIDSTESQPPSSYVLTTHDNTITQNSIHDNTGLGIDLLPYNQVNVPGAGTTPDPTVEDGILAPKITGVTATSMAGTTCPDCTVEAYLADTHTVSSTYTLRNYGQGSQYLGSATADGTGAFTLTLATARAAGDVLTADTIDPNGNTSEFAKDVVEGGPLAPTHLTVPALVGSSAVRSVSVSGTSPSDSATATVTFTDAGGATATATGPVANGTFQVTGDISALADGTITVAVQLQDAAGQYSPVTTTSTTKDTVAPSLTGSTPAAGSTVATPASITLQFSEALDPSSTVTVSGTGGPVTGTTTLTADRTGLIFTPDAPLATDSYTANVQAIDPAGNAADTTVSFTVDATAPAAPALTLPDAINSLNQISVPVSGTAEPSSTVAVSATGGTTTVNGTTTADPSTGDFSLTLDLSQLADGTVDFTATATDAVGNVSTPATGQVTKATSGPKLASSTPGTGETVQPPSDITVTLTQPLASYTMAVTLGGQAVDGSPTLSDDGTTITFTPASAFADGAYDVVVTGEDADGNPGSAHVTFTVDGTAPAAPTLTTPATVDYSTQTALAVSGSSEPNATVTIEASNGTGSTSTVVGADTSGNFATTLDVSALADGTLTVSAFATDGVGNVGPTATTSVVKKTLADAPSLTAASSGNTTIDLGWQAPQNTGGAPIDSYNVSLTDPNNNTTNVTVAGSATTYEFAGLTDGTAYNVSVMAQTAAGNGASTTPRSVITKWTAKMSIAASTLAVKSGQSLTLTGRLFVADTGAALKRNNIVIWGVNTNGVKSKLFIQVPSDVNGNFSKTFSPTTSMKYYATWAGDASNTFAQSPNTQLVTVS